MVEISSDQSVTKLTSNVVKLSVKSQMNTEIDLFVSTPVFSQDAQRCSIPNSDWNVEVNDSFERVFIPDHLKCDELPTVTGQFPPA